mgnify:CR=1 FL=1
MIRLKAVALDGFRGYPQPATFEFPKDGSLLLFARNGHGKSSLSDAFEFLVSRDGTLERLGLKKGPTTSGRAPLRNSTLPEDHSAFVSVSFEDGQTPVQVVREAAETSAGIPEALQPFVSAAVVPFIVRGPELRAFVYQTPVQRYDELARYLNASRLSKLQSDVRQIQRELNKDERLTANAMKKLHAEAQAMTGGFAKTCEKTPLLSWLNEKLAPASIRMNDLSDVDDGYGELRLSEANERSTSALEFARTELSRLLERIDGTPTVETWLAPVAEARGGVVTLGARIVETPVSDLMDAASQYLSDSQNAVSECPLCGTEYGNTEVGSREGVVGRINSARDALAGLRSAVEVQKAAEVELERLGAEAISTLVRSLSLAQVDSQRIVDIESSLRSVLQGGARHMSVFEERATRLIDDLDEVRRSRTASQGMLYGRLLAHADACINLLEQKRQLDERVRRRTQVQSDIAIARKYIDNRVHGFFTDTVDAISKRTIEFYEAVQKHSRVPARVSVELTPAENEDARGIEILIDFDGNPGMKPQAYLSDSQQHTLALGLRLAIIRHFNRHLPLVVLDDVVTSYDAETRNTTAKVLTSLFQDVQLIVLTHDDTFWRYMRTGLKPKQANWKVRRVKNYDLRFGPEFIDTKPDQDIVRDAIKSGDESAGSQARRFYERWLHPMARAVGARPLMPNALDPYEYTNRDLLESIITATADYGMKPRLKNDATVRQIVEELRDSVVFNKSTHGDDSQDGDPSIGDIEDAFESLLTFIALFRCGCSEAIFRYASNEVRCNKCGQRLQVLPSSATSIPA